MIMCCNFCFWCIHLCQYAHDFTVYLINCWNFFNQLWWCLNKVQNPLTLRRFFTFCLIMNNLSLWFVIVKISLCVFIKQAALHSLVILAGHTEPHLHSAPVLCTSYLLAMSSSAHNPRVQTGLVHPALVEDCYAWKVIHSNCKPGPSIQNSC